ncbi:flavin monoamine oxidase family protein [Gordonia phthalatica]|uniref:Amine oxidase n=1 Tax=Gordonia phthalatica TaxID=1136941 RepID=A0A0N7FVC7_9ACTN|nr:NAD(P)/FAD-dependent oxidoreductase [Gordonia phthalatica]ALG86791.1 amine oxidase [Gordonia phthalatica]
MIGPDFPFPYDDFRGHPAGLGSIPNAARGTPIAVIGAGLSGTVVAYELARMGLRPVVYEAEEIGGRMRSSSFDGHPGTVAEMGAMRFPSSSTTLFGYLDEMGLRTVPFPNPLAAATPDTVIDLKGITVHGRTLDDLPEVFARVARAWDATLEDGADITALRTALRARDTGAVAALWHRLVQRYDDTSFYRFLADSPHLRSFADRELFGQVGFGTGGWDTDFSNSILEVLRVVATAADEDHRGIVGGCRRLPRALWSHPLRSAVGRPAGASVAGLHDGGVPRPAVTDIARSPSGSITITDATGETAEYPAVVNTAPVWLLLSTIRCDESLFDALHWSAIERTHYMGSSKVFVLVDRPFWRDREPRTGRYPMSMTLTDRMPRGVYLMDGALSGTDSEDGGDDGPAVICLSYTWTDDSLKLLPLDATERMELMLTSLSRIYPDLDLRSRIIAPPLTVSWETERNFMGAFRANLPGHYRYQERLFTHFMQDDFEAPHRGIFLAGDDISWTAGWAEGAVQTALNAVWGVMHHLGGACWPDNPGPGDRFAELRPLRLPD